jgi:hypothetical protein
MRAKLLQEAAALPEVRAVAACIECTDNASQQLYDALSAATGATHAVLHATARRSPSMTAFQRVIDSNLMSQGKPPIDWRKPIPVRRTSAAPTEPTATDSTAATIPAPPPEFN